MYGETIFGYRFKDHFPGPDWILSFLHRPRGELSSRLCENIKSSKGEVDENVSRKYFQNVVFQVILREKNVFKSFLVTCLSCPVFKHNHNIVSWSNFQKL